MTQLTWSHACTVGVRAMDDQHGILMDSLNEIRLAILHGCGREYLGELLNEITQFTLLHFHCEEHLMEQVGFPQHDEHQLEHQRMMRVLRESVHRVRHDEHVQMHLLLRNLRDQFFHHIEEADQRYGIWMNRHGIE